MQTLSIDAMQGAGSAAQTRPSLPMFGDAVNEDVGARATEVSPEAILLERPRPPGSTDDTKVPGSRLSNFRGDMRCWTCGKKRDHLTPNCRYRDIAVRPESYKDPAVPPESYKDPAVPPESYSGYGYGNLILKNQMGTPRAN
ncbi:uncharacterized protein LOC113336727 [Papaver somniferum]|uniref:uncharacterized protein LOC113336727 n=1 Tax=Papaver somniferum TaxID=3469 RepID=UPI000E6FCCBC|nr:uncharacterized protein LOC113336727 [Papaver somniferum]